jgi:signal transduction histidine kinase
MLLDTGEFLSVAIEREYRATSLSDMSDLIVAWQDNILHTVRGSSSARYPVTSEELRGTLLYRGTLTAPFDRLNLVFSINRLPPGPGATVLAWTSAVIALVFMAGFFFLYRLGISQIRLVRQQQDFVSAVSHELKTPLTSIRMYGEMLMEGWVSDDKRKQYYAFIHDESERLTRLISNVLQLAKITRSEPQFDLQARTAAEMMNQVKSKIANQVDRAGFKLQILQDELADRSYVNIDDDSFAQIVINLVDNAIKFSKHADSQTIEISSRVSTSGTTTFSVRDFGPGIARDQMKKIFQLFYRSESELTRETVGTGIGLAIVHQLTLAMNGKVDVVNRDPGAEFRVTFPSALKNSG